MADGLKVVVDSPLMKGRDSSTAAEIGGLRRRIAEKQTADRARQKALRGRMRAIRFYIADFVGDQQGFTERGLIRTNASGFGPHEQGRAAVELDTELVTVYEHV
jgi:hypothetical protein